MTGRRHVLALDQGTTGSTALVVDPEGRVLARGYAELPQYFPRPGWVEHDPEEIWSTVERAARAALAEARDGRADPSRDRLAVPPHGADVRPAPRRRARSAGASADGARSRRVLLGHEDPLAPRRGPRRPRPRRARRARVRHRRCVASLEADGRPRPRHRRDERLAHALPRPPHGRLGRRAARDPGRPACRAPSGGAVLGRRRGDGGPGLAPARGADRGDRRRPASRVVRTGVPRGRRGQEHVWHRVLHAAQHRRGAGRVVARARDHDRLADRRADHVCSRGQRVHRGRRDPVVARRTRAAARRLRSRSRTPAASISSRRSWV